MKTADAIRAMHEQVVDDCLRTLGQYGFVAVAISPAERRNVNPEALKEAMLAAGRQFIAESVVDVDTAFEAAVSQVTQITNFHALHQALLQGWTLAEEGPSRFVMRLRDKRIDVWGNAVRALLKRDIIGATGDGGFVLRSTGAA